jgi:hypothetical protein
MEQKQIADIETIARRRNRHQAVQTVMLALDTEDDSQGTVTIINFYDGCTHTTFTDRLSAWQWLLGQGHESVWACNAEYDLVNLFGVWLGKMCTLQYVRSGLLRASLRDAPIVFYDTLRHWPISVEAMGGYLGLPKLAQNFQSVEYCQRDTEIVWKFAAEMLDRYARMGLRVRATLPAMALQLWRSLCRLDPQTLPQGITDYFRRGYYGGRVEVYQFGRIRGPVYHYDVNSLFPFVMKTKRYPHLSHWREVTSCNLRREGMATVTIALPETRYPCLPIRTTTSGILYPFGVLTGTWCYPEIRQAVADGGRIMRVERVIEFSETCDPFSRFVDLGWSRRQSAPTEFDRVFWKLVMNSLYGKFGQTDGLEMIFDDKSFTLDTVAPHANVIWSAYVTSYARVALLHHLRGAGHVYYTDTDSLFTPVECATGGALGDLKRVGVYDDCEFIGNKIYRVDALYRAKGIPKAGVQDFIRTGRAVYSKPARFKESRRSFLRANVWYEYEKHLTAEYTKRILLSAGATSAWRYDEYMRMHGDGVDVPEMR